MIHRSDIIIIGGGIIGCAIAHALQDYDVTIRIIDPGPTTKSASHAAAGMLAPSFEFGGTVSPLGQLAQESLKAWPAFVVRLEDKTGINLDFRQHGTIELATTGTTAQTPLTNHDPNIWLDRDCLASRLPHLSQHISGGWLNKHDAQIDPRLVLNALRAALSGKPETLWMQAQARRICDNGDKLSTVETLDGQTCAAKWIIIASGIGLTSVQTDFIRPPIIPVKGEAVSVRLALQDNHPVVRGPGIYLCPKAGGRLVIGATEVRGIDSMQIDATSIANLKDAAQNIIPAIKSAVETERWVGIRPGTPDGAPYIGVSRNGPAGIIYAVGHYRNGILFAPETARLVTDLIVNNAPQHVSAAFSPDRPLSRC